MGRYIGVNESGVVSESFPGTPEQQYVYVDFVVTDLRGAVVYARYPKGKSSFNFAARRITLAPTEAVEYLWEVGWDQTDLNGDPVGPGSYQVFGSFPARGGGGPVSLTIR